MKLVHVCLLFAEQIERFTRSNQTASTTDEGIEGSSGSSKKRDARSERKDATALRQTKIAVQTAEIRRIVADDNYVQMIERQVHTFDTEVTFFIPTIHLPLYCTQMIDALTMSVVCWVMIQ
jgi:hypothetical protein